MLYIDGIFFRGLLFERSRNFSFRDWSRLKVVGLISDRLFEEMSRYSRFLAR